MLLSSFNLLISNITFPFGNAIISLLLWIDSALYKILANLYKAFIQLAQQELFKVDAFENIYNNIYLIVGIIALFVLAFLLLQHIVNPESNSAKNIKEMIIRFVASMFLISLLPAFFSFLMDAQNSLLEYNVVPKMLIDTTIGVQYTDQETGEELSDVEFINTKDVNLTTPILEYRVNEMIGIIISGMMYPLTSANEKYEGDPATKSYDASIDTYRYYEADGSEWVDKVSEWWDGGTQAATSGVGCAVGIVGAFVVFLIPVVRETLGAYTLGTAVAGCIAGGAVAYGGGSALAAIDADAYTWTNALQAITIKGNYSPITLFSSAIVEGRFHYTPIISTIVVGFLIYIMIGFCIDVVVRQAKLIFYQLLAPLCFLISVIPSKKDLMKNWFKMVFTTWFEVFIRIAVMCTVILLISKLDLDAITSIFHPIISSFIVLGLVIFAKQLPELFSKITGIDSGNLKLGLKDKLAAGGAFTAGAILGGGVSALTRNATNGIGNVKNKFKKGEDGKWHRKEGVRKRDIATGIAGGLASTFAGGVSGAVRSGKAGWSAKSTGDMKSSAAGGAAKAVSARDKRSAYKAKHGGNLQGVALGHISDMGYDIASWAGYNNISDLLAENQLISDVQSQRKAIDNEARELILGDIQKMKGRSNYDTASHNMKRMEELNAQLAAAKSGSLSRITDSTGRLITDSHEIILEAERQYSSYLKQWQDELVDMSMLGEIAWESVNEKTRSELAKVRMAGDKYRETLSRNITAPFVASLSETARAELLDKNVSLTVSHEALDSIKDKMKIEQTQISKKINEIRQKEEERKKDK